MAELFQARRRRLDSVSVYPDINEATFQHELWEIYCSDIIESVTLGHKLNPGEGPEAMRRFAEEKGFEKCGLPPAIGAGLAAGFIIDKTAKREGLLSYSDLH